MHENGLLAGIVHDCFIHLIRRQLLNTLGPYFVGLAHGYPHVSVDHVHILRARLHILGQGNTAAGLCRNGLTLRYQLLRREIFCGGTCGKVHAHLRAGYHQRVTHVVTGVSHVGHADSLQMSEMFTDGQKVCQHLGGMEFVGQAVPYGHLGIFCQFLHNILSEATIFDTLEHACQYSGSIGNAFLFADLGSGGIQISRSHSQIMGCHFKSTSGTGTGLLKDQRYILASESIYGDSFFLLILQVCRQIQQIFDLFRCKVQ